jgi:hypothetical protein|tara:strand:+ start:7238 stop:8266 length:1029 start_codon:yes stop_codon:yes gene_type:complete
MHAAASLRGFGVVTASLPNCPSASRTTGRNVRSASWQGKSSSSPQRRVSVRAQDSDNQEPKEELDFITRMVVKVFGDDVMSDPEPMGLKRMSKEEWPDQWPALCDGTLGNALPEDDTQELLKVRKVLAQTQLENMPLGIAYDANVHGWKASSFHTQCDGQGAAVLIAESTSGLVFGGYNPKGWLGYGEWLDAISAFLWVYPLEGGVLGIGGNASSSPVKLGKTGGSGMAIIDDDGKGPKWGPDGLAIDLENQVARSRLGSYYVQMPSGNPKSLFGKGGAVELKSLRIYVALGDSDLAKSYEPNMFQWKKGELEGIRKNDPGNLEGDGVEEKQSNGFKFPWDK